MLPRISRKSPSILHPPRDDALILIRLASVYPFYLNNSCKSLSIARFVVAGTDLISMPKSSMDLSLCKSPRINKSAFFTTFFRSAFSLSISISEQILTMIFAISS
nr:hypothetical protein [Candidatus Sigynarchaeota archaeon]